MKLNKLNLTIAACLLYSSSVLATASNIDDDMTIQENSKKNYSYVITYDKDMSSSVEVKI